MMTLTTTRSVRESSVVSKQIPPPPLPIPLPHPLPLPLTLPLPLHLPHTLPLALPLPLTLPLELPLPLTLPLALLLCSSNKISFHTPKLEAVNRFNVPSSSKCTLLHILAE